MEKEVGTASEMVKLEVSGGFQGFKETVFNALGNFFGWLSTHQGPGLILILIVLVIILWLIMRIRKYRIQVKNEIYLKKKEIGKKDAVIEEQGNKLAALQKKLSDQQAVASGAMLKTLSTLTGYDADQLPIFFKSLSQISENPLQMADPRAIPAPESRLLEAQNDNAPKIADTTETAVSGDDFSKKDDTKEEISSAESSTDVKEAEKKLAAGDSPAEENDTKERLVSNHDSSEKTDAKEEVASGDDASKEDNAKKEKSASSDGPEEAAETKKTGE